MLYPSHYSGSVCGRGLSANPVSTIGFERRHNPALQFSSEEEFVQALTQDIPPAPEQQAAIVAANRSGRPLAEVAVTGRRGSARAARERRAVLAAGR